MNKPRASTLGVPVAVVFAAAITVVSVWLLSMLNARAMPEPPVPEPIRTVMIRGKSAERVRRPQRPQRPLPVSAPPQKMTATLETPTFEPLTPPPLALQLDLPEPKVESVEIAIFQPTEQRPELKPLEMNLDKVAAELTTQQALPTVVPRQSVPLPTANRSRLDNSPPSMSAPTRNLARTQTDQAVAAPTEVASVNQRSVKPTELTPRELALDRVTSRSTPERRVQDPSPTQSVTSPTATRTQVDRSTQSVARSARSVARGRTGSAVPNTSTLASAGSTVHRADRVDRAPQETSGNSQPTYPTRERNLGIEGSVLLKLLIDEKGRVKEAQVLRGPEAFRKSVLSVAFDWKFTPAQHEGRPVKVWGVKEVRFQLRTQ